MHVEKRDQGVVYRRLMTTQWADPRLSCGSAGRQSPGWRLIATIVILCAACVPDRGADLESLVEQSNFVFRGTVVESAATATPEVAVSENTVIVELEEVFEGGEILGEAPGTRITVLLKRPDRPAEGVTALFFAAGWLFGEGVAVREVGHQLDPQDPSDLRRRLEQARQAIEDRELEARIRSAELVVSGQVLEVVDVPPVGEPISEHAPGWVEAQIQVERVFKGTASSGPASFLYPSSPDVMWKDAPKPIPQQQGVWILHRDERLEALTVSAAIDFQTIDSVERIQTLAERTEGGS